ncbi:hypothetical protein MD484_g7164, partial [Candolleomyces efflorescens]
MTSISPLPPDSSSAPFEGPEKLLEIWFAPSAAHIQAVSPDDPRTGLRLVERHVWEEMLDIVKCKVLSVVNGVEMDAYLLSESSLFVSPHKLILKTCGTTLNLLGLPRILEIAANVNLSTVYRLFYSRKSFMFPERQSGPHRDWKEEVEFLDRYFPNGAAYTIGKMNGDHWLLYLTNPEDQLQASSSGISPSENEDEHPDYHPPLVHPDYTIEILMSGLSGPARDPFFNSELSEENLDSTLPSTHAQALSQKLGISDIFPQHLTTLDAYSFIPCGYSSNALIKWGDENLQLDSPSHGPPASSHSGEGYYTIHVTPEEGWSYASFECNVPLSVGGHPPDVEKKIPSLKDLVKRVVSIFQPTRLTLTLFISAEDNESAQGGPSAVELAQRSFKAALDESPYSIEDKPAKYKRTDKINYEFGGYDLAFASFELK